MKQKARGKPFHGRNGKKSPLAPYFINENKKCFEKSKGSRSRMMSSVQDSNLDPFYSKSMFFPLTAYSFMEQLELKPL